MKKIDDIKEIQKIELNLLVHLVKKLEEYNITYFLAGGTLLGAIRHDGFIPWDDDIDILIPRSDYEILKKLIIQGKINTKQYVYKIPGERNYPYPFIKGYDLKTKIKNENLKSKFDDHIWVDVFPLDHLPDDINKNKQLLMKKYYFLLAPLYYGILEKNKFPVNNFIKKMIYNIIYKLNGYQKLSKKIDLMGKKIDKRYKSSNHYGHFVWNDGYKDYFTGEMITPLIKKKFEDYEFYIPENYDLYLKSFYGDYMTPPPENSRQQHTFEAFYVEKD